MPSPSPALISDEYRRMQQELHRKPTYGIASTLYAPLVVEVMQAFGMREVLDYGAGKGRLAGELRAAFKEPIQVHHYEPAVPQWANPPAPCRCVACIDVLEHIEPELLDNVLDDLARVTIGVGIFTLQTGPATKHLPDGRNAHLIQQPQAWWLPKLVTRFELNTLKKTAEGFWVIVERLQPTQQDRQ